MCRPMCVHMYFRPAVELQMEIRHNKQHNIFCVIDKKRTDLVKIRMQQKQLQIVLSRFAKTLSFLPDERGQV